jgi:hypothetical protein
MRDMFNTLKEAFKENPLEVIYGGLFMTSIFVGLWASLWLVAILEGRV